MYDFHYSYLKDRHGKKARLLFRDTDSLVYEIKANDAYKYFFRKKGMFYLGKIKEETKRLLPMLFSNECLFSTAFFSFRN